MPDETKGGRYLRGMLYSLNNPSAVVDGVWWRVRGPAIMLLLLTSPNPGAMVAPSALTASVELSLLDLFFALLFFLAMVDLAGDGQNRGASYKCSVQSGPV